MRTTFSPSSTMCPLSHWNSRKIQIAIKTSQKVQLDQESSQRRLSSNFLGTARRGSVELQPMPLMTRRKKMKKERRSQRRHPSTGYSSLSSALLRWTKYRPRLPISRRLNNPCRCTFQPALFTATSRVTSKLSKAASQPLLKQSSQSQLSAW